MIKKSHDNGEKRIYAEALRHAAEDYEELVEELSILKLLNDSLQIGLGFDEICHKLVQFLTETMNVENASIMVLDPEKGELRLLVGKSFFENEGTVYAEQMWPGKVFKLGEGIAGQVAKERKSILIEDARTDPRFVSAEGQKVSVRSILCLPLVHGERLHGVLNLSNSEPGAFTAKKEHALNIIASTASVALSQALAVDELIQLNKELTTRNRELGAVIALSESLHSDLDLDLVLAESLRNISDGFDIDGAAIFLGNEGPDSMKLKSCAAKTTDPDVKSLLQLLCERYGAEIARTGGQAPYVGWIDGSDGDEEFRRESKAFVGVSLSSGQTHLGMLIVLCSSKRGLDDAKIRLLDSFCQQVGLAIQNSILVTRLRDNISELKETKHKLVQSDKLALLGEMVSGVAHEINNPLAAIMGYSELLLIKESISRDGRSMLESAISCVDRCRKIMQGLLSFARKTELEKKPADINKIIDRVLAHRDYDLSLNNIEIVKDYEVEKPIVAVDPNQIEQVFLNLLSNAFDSMAGRDVPGILEVRTRLADGDNVRIEFIDNGCGIKESDKARLFEPFFTTKEVGKGTGLGLSVSYGIIREHGGDLYLDDAHYCGAKFIITLPLAPPEQATEKRGDKKEPFVPPNAHGKILVVDDEEIVLDVIEAALSLRGFSVDCAGDGERAYRMMEANKYDLIISDIRMPGAMDGKRLFREIKKENPELAERFVFMSGDVMEKKTAEFLKESGRSHLLKPFSLNALHQVIEKTLQEVRS